MVDGHRSTHSGQRPWSQAVTHLPRALLPATFDVPNDGLAEKFFRVGATATAAADNCPSISISTSITRLDGGFEPCVRVGERLLEAGGSAGRLGGGEARLAQRLARLRHHPRPGLLIDRRAA